MTRTCLNFFPMVQVGHRLTDISLVMFKSHEIGGESIAIDTNPVFGRFPDPKVELRTSFSECLPLEMSCYCNGVTVVDH